MDVFAMQRMRYDGRGLVEDPPTSEMTACTVRYPNDPEKPEVGRYQFNLNSEELVEPWAVCQDVRYP